MSTDRIYWTIFSVLRSLKTEIYIYSATFAGVIVVDEKDEDDNDDNDSKTTNSIACRPLSNSHYYFSNNNYISLLLQILPVIP